MALGEKIAGGLGAPGGLEGIDNDELYLHLFGDEAFDINARVLADGHSFARFRKPGEVGGKLDEHAVVLHRAHDARPARAI